MLLHPLLTSLLVIIAGIKAADIPYQEYAEATKIIDFMLGISVVALGYLLYEQNDSHERKHYSYGYGHFCG
jgi:Putative effector of murein hydrolase